MVRNIYKTVAERGAELPVNLLITLDRFVRSYGKLPEDTIRQIMKEVGMTYSPATYEEFVENRGIEKGISQGAKQNLKELLEDGIISEEVYRERLAKLEAHDSDA